MTITFDIALYPITGVDLDNSHPKQAMEIQVSVQGNLDILNVKKPEHKKKKRHRDAGSVLARKRAQQYKKRDANSRHLTGIVNQAEKNRLTNKEKLIAKTHKITEIQISRTKQQLRDELYEMRAARQALKSHSLGCMEPESANERDCIERLSQRGRYMYAIRTEVKEQKHIMDSYNGRLEVANRRLRPARRESKDAMDLGRNMGSNSPTLYMKLGKRIFNAAKLPPLKDAAFSDSDDDSELERELEHLGHGKNKSTIVEEKPASSSPRPDFVKIRSELGPELQMAIDKLELAELAGLGIGQQHQPLWKKPSIPGSSTGISTFLTTGIDEVIQAQGTTVKGTKGKLTLPPVRVNGRQPQPSVVKKLPGQTTVLDSSNKLTTVCEN